jgi:hypothetical protein
MSRASRFFLGAFQRECTMASTKHSFTYELEIFPTTSFASLLIAAMGGEEATRTKAAAFCGWLDRYGRGDPADCFACGRTLVRAPAAIITLLPMGKGRKAIAGGLRAVCAALPRPTLLQHAITTIRAAAPSAHLQVSPVRGGTA